MTHRSVPSLVLLSMSLLAGCAVGPNYKRPSVITPPAYKEAEGWIKADPADAAPRGDWWTMLNDPVLDQLEKQVDVSNQNLAEAEAAYREAHAMVAYDRAQLFPTGTASGSATRTGSHIPTASSGVVTSGTRNTYELAGGASWEPDLWGKIRRTIEGAKATAQASAADLANARLSAQSELAIDYVQLRADDELKRVTDVTVEGYKRSLQITQNQYDAGVAAKSDVLTAETQLEQAQAQAVDYIRQRQLMEHAIAVLIGQPPANLTIAPTDWTLKTLDVPLAVPSTLLQRRPDIAAAERQAANANAQIGVQEAAFFPSLDLTGQYGVNSASLSTLINASATAWSLGASTSETVIDFGARLAQVRAAKATYQEEVAAYRQTVLSAFQEVEDDLASERVYAQELPLRAAASQAADAAERIALNQYRAGTVDYTTVVVAQSTALTDRTALVTNQMDEIVASLDLVTALGGGWSTAQQPKD